MASITVDKLRASYKRNIKVHGITEILILLGIYFFNLWFVSFWFWGIYRREASVLEKIDRVFYAVWINSYNIAVISIIFSTIFLIYIFVMRNNSFKDLGIRFDNLKASAKECIIAGLIALIPIVVIFLFYIDDYEPHTFSGLMTYYAQYLGGGLAQQFFLQSFLFLSLKNIFKRNFIVIIFAAAIFSLMHMPNIPLVVITFFAGLTSCILFSRNRNIFTLGFFHATFAMIVYVTLCPGLISDTLHIGPKRGEIDFAAKIEYEGGTVCSKPSESISIPLSVVNKGLAVWDSKVDKNPVYISYHIFDSNGNLVQYDNVRTPFPKVIRRGESGSVDMSVDAPSRPGLYILEVDVVKEGVRWFGDADSLVLYIPLFVL